MKNLLLIIAFALLAIPLSAQDKVDSTLNKWMPRGIASANIAQVALSNWSQGGDESITYSLIGDFGLSYKSEKWRLVNNLKANYGQNKVDGDDFKTNENDLYFESIYSRLYGWAADPYISVNVRSSITTGYNYKDSIYPIVDFFDPGYITEAIGFTYDPDKNFKTRLGVAFQQTFANEFRNFTDDSDTPEESEAFKFETGIESVTDYEIEFMENMVFSSKLRLFTRFDRLDVWDVRSDNSIIAKINDIFAVNINVLIVHEISQSRFTQVKEALQFGIRYTIF
jgi:Protein of unknown function (DUF3078)